MYFKLDEINGKKVSFFKKEKEVKGVKLYNTDKSVFANLSDGIKTGENNGKPIWDNDIWDTIFCGKCYERALELKDRERIAITEFAIRNKYSKTLKKNFPSLIVYDFIILNTNDDDFVQAPENPDDLC